MNAQSRKARRRLSVRAAFLLAVMVAGCAPQATEPPPPPASPTPADTPTPPPTDTPQPTETPEPTLTATPTATATATATPDLAATAAFEATQAAEVIIGDIHAELEEAGYMADGGQLAFVGDQPVTMRLTGYSTHRWLPLAEGESFSDFALGADITWESTSGLALCGFWLRGESDHKDAEHVTFEALRLSGLPAWGVLLWKYNRIQARLTGDLKTSSAINQEQGSTNKYLLVAEGSTMHAFVNGKSLGRVTVTRPEDGIIALYIRQESGETTCTYDNVWLWDLSERRANQ